MYLKSKGFNLKNIAMLLSIKIRMKSKLLISELIDSMLWHLTPYFSSADLTDMSAP